MITVITSSGPDQDSFFDLRFGRSPFLCLVNTESGKTEFIENQYAGLGEGAGIGLAEEIIRMGVTQIISGDFGPKAQKRLQQSDIQLIVLPDKDKSIREIIAQLNL
jgi:predicted Fe-Mo cluster-binding NifX family protein